MKIIFIFAFIIFPLTLYGVDNSHLRSADELIKQSKKLFQENKTEQGKALLRKSINLAPDYYLSYYEFGKYYYNQGLFKLASIQLNSAQSKYLKSYGTKNFYTQLRPILMLLGSSYLELEKYNHAHTVFKQILTVDPKDTSALEKLAWNYYKLEDYRQAKLFINRCLKENPYDSNCLNVRGIIYLQEKQYKKSLEQYQKAYGLHSDTKNHNMAAAYLGLFDYEKAKYHLNKVVFVKNRLVSSLSFVQLADIYIGSLNLSQAKKILSQYEKSRVELAKIINLPKTNDMGFIYLSQAQLYYYEGHLEEALKYCQLALDYPLNYGSIGHKKEQFLHISHFTLSLIYTALSHYEEEIINDSLLDALQSCYRSLEYQAKSWWHLNKAVEIFINISKNLKELYFSDLGSLIDYVHLGILIKELDSPQIREKLTCLLGETNCLKRDKRIRSQAFYSLYLGEYAYYNGNLKQSYHLINSALSQFSPNEKTYSIRALDILSRIYSDNNQGKKLVDSINRLYFLHKPSLRFLGKNLPAFIEINLDNSITEKAAEYLSKKRFGFRKKAYKYSSTILYTVRVSWNEKNSLLQLALIKKKGKVVLFEMEAIIEDEKKDIKTCVNDFADKCFSY